jgi:hypothetical protein
MTVSDFSSMRSAWRLRRNVVCIIVAIGALCILLQRQFLDVGQPPVLLSPWLPTVATAAGCLGFLFPVAKLLEVADRLGMRCPKCRRFLFAYRATNVEKTGHCPVCGMALIVKVRGT